MNKISGNSKIESTKIEPTISYHTEKKVATLKLEDKSIMIISKDSLKSLDTLQNWISLKVLGKKVWVKVELKTEDAQTKVIYLKVNDLAKKIKVTEKTASNLQFNPNSSYISQKIKMEIEKKRKEEIQKLEINPDTKAKITETMNEMRGMEEQEFHFGEMNSIELEKFEKLLESNIKDLSFNLIKNTFDELVNKAMEKGISKSNAQAELMNHPVILELKDKVNELESIQKQITIILGSKRDRSIVKLMENSEFKGDFKKMVDEIVKGDSKDITSNWKNNRETLLSMAANYLKQKKGEGTVEIEVDDLQVLLEAGFKAMKESNLEEYENLHDKLNNIKIDENKHSAESGQLHVMQAISSAVFNGEV